VLRPGQHWGRFAPLMQALPATSLARLAPHPPVNPVRVAPPVTGRVAVMVPPLRPLAQSWPLLPPCALVAVIGDPRRHTGGEHGAVATDGVLAGLTVCISGSELLKVFHVLSALPVRRTRLRTSDQRPAAFVVVEGAPCQL